MSCAAQAAPASVIATAGRCTYPSDASSTRYHGASKPRPNRMPSESRSSAGPVNPASRTSSAAGPRRCRTMRQPEPRVHRRQEEEERIRVRCQNEQRDDAQARAAPPSGRRAARRRRRGAAARAAAARGARPGATRVPARAARARASCPPSPSPGSADARRPDGHAPSARSSVEGDADEEPHEEPAAQTRDRREQRDVPAAAVCEQVDDGDDERERAARRAAARWPSRERCGRRSSTYVVVPGASPRPWSSEPTSCCAARPSCAEVRGGERVARSVNACGGRAPEVVSVSDGNAARDERALFVEREREAEIDQLAEDAGAAGRDARLLTRPGAMRSRRATAAGERGASPAISSARRAAAADRGEVDRPRRRATAGVPRSAPRRDRRTRRRRSRGTRSCARSERPAQRRRDSAYPRASSTRAAVPLALSFGARPGAGVVAMCEHDDRVCRDCPGATAQRLCSWTCPSPGTRCATCPTRP